MPAIGLNILEVVCSNTPTLKGSADSGVTPIRGFPLFRTHFVFVIYGSPLRFGQDRKVSHVTASWV